jgi:hypothetical protein
LTFIKNLHQNNKWSNPFSDYSWNVWQKWEKGALGLAKLLGGVYTPTTQIPVLFDSKLGAYF